MRRSIFHTKRRPMDASTHHRYAHSPLLVLYLALIQCILASAHTAVHAASICCAAHHFKLDKILPLYMPADFVDPKRTIRSISILHSVTASCAITIIHNTPDSSIHLSASWTLHRSAFWLKIHF